MLLIVRYNPGNGGWAVTNIINTCLGHTLQPSEAEQFEGNGHNTSLYDRLSSEKELMRTQTDTSINFEYEAYSEGICLPIHYEFNTPTSAEHVIDVFRSSNHHYVPWNLHNKEEDWELTPQFIDRAIEMSTNKNTGDFDTAIAFDDHNPDYVGKFLSKYSLVPTEETWHFYYDYVTKQKELNSKCTITQT